MTTLHYAPPVSRWRRRMRRGMIAMLLLSAVALSVVWSARFVQQIILVEQQQALLNFALPANTIVASTDQIGDQGLLNIPGYQLQKPGPFMASSIPSVIALNSTSQPPWGQINPRVFLHRLRAKGQQWRLVSVSLQPTSPFLPENAQGMLLEPLVQMPATLSIGSRLSVCSTFRETSLQIPYNSSFRLYAGQSDASDASHFTIVYEHNFQKDTIDGFLLSDDMVKLEIRKRIDFKTAGAARP